MGFFQVLMLIFVGIGYALRHKLPILNCMQSMNRKVYTPIWIITYVI